ncbi:MAG: septum formation inhibitor MinC [Rhizobiales bacterium]|nr:septum formation inhibitor MinC [Hyphomicrobiales bacterium]
MDANNLIRFCIRSYIAFVLAPQAPIVDWLHQLDNWTRSSPGFFVGRPVVLDLSTVKLSQAGIRHLLEQLAERSIRIIGLEGTDSSELDTSLPPLLTGGRPSERQATPAAATTKPTAAPDIPDEPSSLLIETPVRSGQTVVFPSGDVTVLGSVASGSEIIAGGSIHVYGTLRGRAMAGSRGNSDARIFCRKNEAELLAINGYYRTAEEWGADIRSQAVQSWLEDGVLKVAPLD